MNECPECGKPVALSWKFCRSCGADMAGARSRPAAKPAAQRRDHDDDLKPRARQIECPVCHKMILNTLEKCPYCESTLHSGKYEPVPKPSDFQMDFHIKGTLVFAMIGFTWLSMLARFGWGGNFITFGFIGAGVFTVLGYFLLLYSDAVRELFSWVDRLTVLPEGSFLRKLVGKFIKLPD